MCAEHGCKVVAVLEYDKAGVWSGIIDRRCWSMVSYASTIDSVTVDSPSESPEAG